jgi:hypothetical protein
VDSDVGSDSDHGEYGKDEPEEKEASSGSDADGEDEDGEGEDEEEEGEDEEDEEVMSGKELASDRKGKGKASNVDESGSIAETPNLSSSTSSPEPKVLSPSIPSCATLPHESISGNQSTSDTSSGTNSVKSVIMIYRRPKQDSPISGNSRSPSESRSRSDKSVAYCIVVALQAVISNYRTSITLPRTKANHLYPKQRQPSASALVPKTGNTATSAGLGVQRAQRQPRYNKDLPC